MQRSPRNFGDKMGFRHAHILCKLCAFFPNGGGDGVQPFFGSGFGHNKGVNIVIIRALVRHAANDKFFDAGQVGIFFLDIVGRHFFAVCKHNIFFGTPRNAHIAVFILRAEVARHKPAVLGKGGFGRLFVTEIALHHKGGLYQQFAAVADFQRNRRIRLAAGIGLNILGAVADGGNIGLRRAVGNQNIKARAVIKIGNLFGKRRPRRAEELQTAAEALVNGFEQFFAQQTAVFAAQF